MKFFASATTAATFFAGLVSAYNGFINPVEGEVIPAGGPYLIKWAADTGRDIAITLMKGDRKNLSEKYQIVMLEYNWGNYTWDIPADTPAGKDYALKLQWGKDPRPEDVNYTGLFEITSNAKEDDQKSTTKTSKPTTTVSDSATETATATEETATETVTTKTGGDQTHTIANTTMTYTPTGSKTSTTKTSSSPTSTSTAPSSHDSDASACSIGASVGMAAAVAVAAAALL